MHVLLQGRGQHRNAILIGSSVSMAQHTAAASYLILMLEFKMSRLYGGEPWHE